MDKNEFGSDRTPNPESGVEVLHALDGICQKLRYTELQEHSELRQQYIRAAQSGDTELRNTCMARYQDAVHEEIGWVPEHDMHIGFLVACARMRLEAGLIEDCLADLEDIYMTTSFAPGFDDLANEIQNITNNLRSLHNGS